MEYKLRNYCHLKLQSKHTKHKLLEELELYAGGLIKLCLKQRPHTERTFSNYRQPELSFGTSIFSGPLHQFLSFLLYFKQKNK